MTALHKGTNPELNVSKLLSNSSYRDGLGVMEKRDVSEAHQA
jgi:hypothetical protein